MDRALIERARAGDHDAFSDLTAASIGRLYAVAALILRDQDRASDAVQDALVAAWRGIRALRDPDAWDAWLHRLVVRACYRLARQDRRVFVAELRLEQDMDPMIDDASLSLSDRDQLDRGFRRLAVDQRAVLVLHYYLGLSLNESADLLGVAPGTVKSRLHRATQLMRAALEADARDPMPSWERLA